MDMKGVARGDTKLCSSADLYRAFQLLSAHSFGFVALLFWVILSSVTAFTSSRSRQLFTI